MNRRDFLTVAGGVSAASILTAHPVFAEATTSLYVKGLVMVSFEDANLLRLGFPKAPGHKATLSVVPQAGATRVLTIKGNGAVETKSPALTEPKIVVPELVRMKEFYGDSVRSRIAECPTVISIPYRAIRSIATTEVSASRYTFLRADNGKEVASFRQRQLAETIKIDLLSPGTLKLDNGKTSIPLETARELHAEYRPESNTASTTDAFADHFHHYFMYLERPAAANFDVVPKKLGGNSVTPPKAGNSFIWPYVFCYLVGIP